MRDPGTNRKEVLPSKTPYIDLEAGALVRVQSAGGGGYGDSRARDPGRIAEDLENGYVTEKTAVAEYSYSPKTER